MSIVIIMLVIMILKYLAKQNIPCFFITFESQMPPKIFEIALGKMWSKKFSAELSLALISAPLSLKPGWNQHVLCVKNRY